jgi:hypothetical protein
MRILRFSFLVVAVFLAHQAFAGIRSSFSLDYSAWQATHIVLVVTTYKDGTFEVVESLRGNLPVGEQIVIPELRPNPGAVPISQYPQAWPYYGEMSEQIPREPVGSRMVLFLKSTTGEQSRPHAPSSAEAEGWKPSGLMDSMKASVIWLNEGGIYCFEQFINPGPTVLSPSRYSEADVRNRVAEISDIRQNTATILAIKDGSERAERLKPWVRSDVFPVRLFSLKELGECGPAGVPTISGMLDDPTFTDEGPELVEALVQAGGEAVGEELNKRLRQEFVFWRSTAPSLSHGWWNQDMSSHAPLRVRYDRTYQLIIGLEQKRYAPALTTTVQLRDFWLSLPQLSDYKGLPEECGKLIRELQVRVKQ